MKTGKTIAEEALPKGIWRKTHRVPKPVGIPLWIRSATEEIHEDIHSGSPTFEYNGKIVMNTVYSYDKTEEWLEVGQ